MHLKLVSTRPLSQAELSLLRDESILHGDGMRRREFLKRAGLTPLLLCPLLPSRQARAQVRFFRVFIEEAKVWGPVGVGLAIPATITLRNLNPDPAEGQIVLQHRDPDGFIRNRASYFVSLPALSVNTVPHDKFLARTIGANEYMAQSELNFGKDIFQVIDR